MEIVGVVTALVIPEAAGSPPCPLRVSTVNDCRGLAIWEGRKKASYPQQACVPAHWGRETQLPF